MTVVQTDSVGSWPRRRVAKFAIILMLVIGLAYIFFGKSEFLWRKIVLMKDPGFENCKREKALPLYDGHQFAVCEVGEQNAEQFTAYIFDSSGQIARASGKKRPSLDAYY
jgi:hypothetical protein